MSNGRGPFRGAAHEVRMLTTRQATAVVIATTLTVGLLLSTVLGLQLLAIALTGLLPAMVFVGVVQVRRRMGHEIGQLGRELDRTRKQLDGTRKQLAGLADHLQFVQRQVIAAIENERLMASDRHSELQTVLDQVQTALHGEPPPENRSTTITGVGV